MEAFLPFYLIVGLLIILLGVLASGYRYGSDRNNFNSDYMGILFVSMIIGLFWPFIIILIIVLFPFFMVFKLGEYYYTSRHKRE